MRQDRGYQNEAANAVIEKFEVADRTQIHMAPGSGKTIIALMIKEKMDVRLTVMFLPTIQLVHQQYMAWARYSEQEFSAIVVASGRMSRADEAELAMLEALHVGTTTTAEPIINFINDVDQGVIFCTYRSAPLLADVVNETGVPIDFANFDEAHRVAGLSSKQVNVLLHNEQIAFRKRLFMTATPRVLNDEPDSITYCGMDDIRLFGEVAYKLSFRAAIEKGILVDYQLIAAIVTQEDIADVNVEGDYARKAALAAIRKTVTEFDLRNGLSFHSTIRDAAEFAHMLAAVMPDTYVETLNANHNADQRQNVLDAMRRSERSIVTNVRILGEGFDYTALDHIIFVGSKTSQVDIIQNIGRVMRIHDGKTIGTIILPIIVDSDNGSILWNARNFTNVYRVTNAMAAVDEMLGTLIGISRSSARPTGEMRWFLSRHIRVAGLNDEALREVDSLVEKVTLRILAGSNRRIAEDESERRLAAVTEFCESNQRTPGTKDGEVYDSYLLFVHPHRPMDRFKKAALELKKKYSSNRAKATSDGHKMRGGMNNPKVVAQLEELRAYCRDEGVRPKVSSSLGRFLDKRHSKRADPQLIAELKAIAERYPTEKDKQFDDLYTRFFEFVEEYDRLPRQSSPEEKQLAVWASRVRRKPYLLGERFEEFNRVYESVVTTTRPRHRIAG